MFSRFADEPGLLYVVATLLPLASFAALLVAGGLKNLGRTYKHTGWGQSLYWLLGGDEPGRGGAYLATGAIGLSCVIAVLGLVRFLSEHPAMGPHAEWLVAAAPHHEAAADGWAGRMTFLQVGRLYDDPRPALKLELGYRIDHLAAVMFAMVTFVAFLIHVFALGYMADETQQVVEDHQAHVARR